MIDQLLDRLDELEIEQPGDIYVLASSSILNSDTLKTYCHAYPRGQFSCGHILSTNDVDKRDGFPRQFLSAQYLLLASPTQFHLRPNDQRVIGVLAAEVIEKHGIGGSFVRLPGEFKLDQGVTVSVYAKVNPLEGTDLKALADEFRRLYPDKGDLFTIFDK